MVPENFGVSLFDWFQDSGHVRSVNVSAVAFAASLGAFSGKWIDVGCGPWALVRQAASAWFEAYGADVSVASVRKAEALGEAFGTPASYFAVPCEDLPVNAFDVVSASSLLAVVSDKSAAFDALYRCVKPGGLLLILEPSRRMSFSNAVSALLAGEIPPWGRSSFLLWSTVRSWGTDWRSEIREPQWSDPVRAELLGWFVEAVAYRKP